MMKLDFAVGRTILKIYIHTCCGKVEEEKRGDFDYWIRPSKKRQEKDGKRRKTKRTVTILERRARRRASSSPAERMW